VITSDAYSHFDLRAPRQLKALARLLPLEDTEATAALSSAPRNIIKRSAQKKRSAHETTSATLRDSFRYVAFTLNSEEPVRTRDLQAEIFDAAKSLFGDVE